MEKVVPSGESSFSSPPEGSGSLERLASFRFTYLAIFVFLLGYVFSALALEAVLRMHFEAALDEAIRIEAPPGMLEYEVEQRADALLRRSWWVSPGGVRVDAQVVAVDGRTLLFSSRRRMPPPDPSRLLADPGTHDPRPLSVDVVVSVPHNSLVANAILVLYAGLLIALLYGYTRVLTRREAEHMAGVVAMRDSIAERARSIEGELEGVRERLSRVGSARAHQADAIRAMESERAELLQRLHELEQHEEALRAEEDHESASLREEHEALEALLEEALADMDRRDDEIRELQKQLKQSGKAAASASRRGVQVGRRLRALYKNLEIDDRAVDDVVKLRDEALALKAEEAMKRLSDDAERAAVRRKVGGLPPGLSIFELGFGGKGRIYYSRGKARRHRILLVGTKATQKPDLEYLSRLPRD